jgi:hypothetical protein
MSLDDLVVKAKGEPLPAAVPLPPPASGGELPDSVDSILGHPGQVESPVAAGAKPPATGEALIAMLDGLTPLVVRLCCIRSRVRFTAELTRECRLNEAEKQQLRMTADAAAPILSKLLEQSGPVSVGIFGITYVMIIQSKINFIRSLAPVEKPKDEPPAGAEAEKPLAASAVPVNPAAPGGRRPYVRTGKFAGVAAAKAARRESRKEAK